MEAEAGAKPPLHRSARNNNARQSRQTDKRHTKIKRTQAGRGRGLYRGVVPETPPEKEERKRDNIPQRKTNEIEEKAIEQLTPC